MKYFFIIVLTTGLFTTEIHTAKAQNQSPFNCTYVNHSSQGKGGLRSQHDRSWFGNVFTPKGNIHTLIVFIGFNTATSTDDLPKWPHNDLPDWAKGDDNILVNKDITKIGSHENLSYWYHEMSNGQFTLTGKVFHEQVMVNPLFIPNTNLLDYSGMNQAVFHYIDSLYPSFNWSAFDNRINRPNYQFDNSLFADTLGNPAQGDNIIDYVVLVYREPSTYPGGHSHIDGSHTVTTNFSGTPETFTISNGGFTLKEIGNGAPFNGLFIHELAHELFDAPHYFGANDAVGTSLYCNYGWGMMGGYLFPVANAWERWWLNWTTPQFITTNGTYTLNDYMTTGDAIRIPLPHAPNHYLWIENHQLTHPLDRKNGYTTQSPIQQGIYMYTTSIGDDQTDPWDVDITDVKTNRLKILTPQGNHDHTWDGNTTLTVPGAAMGTPQPVFAQIAPNPISGQNALTLLRMDLDGDNNIEIEEHRNGGCNGCLPNEQTPILAELKNGTPTLTYALSGSTSDAFQVGDEVGISGNIPALNQPFYNQATQELSFITLNGLSVKVTNYNLTTGQYTINVNFNDWTIDHDQRWCGNITLPQNEHLTIAPHQTLHLDRSITPTRHTPDSATGHYSNPTYFECLSGSYITLSANSTVKVDAQSTLAMASGSQLDIFTGAALEVSNGAKVELNANAQITIKNGGALTVRSGGTLLLRSGANLTVQSGGSLYIEPGGTVTLLDPAIDNTIDFNHYNTALPQPTLKVAGTIATTAAGDFSFTGNGGQGIIILEQGANFQLNNSKRFIISGQHKTQKLVEVNGVRPAVNGKEVVFENCKVVFRGSSAFEVNNGTLDARNATFEQAGQRFSTGLQADLSDVEITNCTFTGLRKGVSISNVPPVDPTFPNPKITIENSVFTNCSNGAWVEDAQNKPVEVSNTTFSGCDSGLKGVRSNIIYSSNNHYTGNNHGLEMLNVYALYCETDKIEQCHNGIRGSNTNVFIRDKTTIEDNNTGIYMSASGTDQFKLTIGDKGCGYIINNLTGIRGSDIVLNIDAVIHACQRGNCANIIPNRFDGNSTMFSLCYNSFQPAAINVKGNYWGSKGGGSQFNPGLPLKSFHYHTGSGKSCTKNTIQVNDKPVQFLTPNCAVMFGPLPQKGTFPFKNSISFMQAPGSTQTLSQDFNTAYSNFLNEDYAVATAQFEAIGKTDLTKGNIRGVDDQLVRVARALSKVGAAHQSTTTTPKTLDITNIKEDKTPEDATRPNASNIYPNPSDHTLYIDFTYPGEHHINLFNSLGQSVFQTTASGAQAQINTSQLENGLYIIHLKDHSNNKTQVSKVMVQ